LRLGEHPQTIITTTPRPTPIIKDIVKQVGKGTIITTGSTFENQDNLAPAALKKLKQKYEGTRLGRQELYAELLEDVEGALWSRDMLDATRVDAYPEMTRIVVAVDPSTTSDKTSDECGMLVGGLGKNGHAYVFEDISAIMSPDDTSRIAIEALKLWGADRIVAEANNGGDWIELGLRQHMKNVPYKKLHASRGKQARAEPVVSLYEQKRVHHVGVFPVMEDELCSWEPNSGMASPNRLDAVVWLVTELMLGDTGMEILHVRA